MTTKQDDVPSVACLVVVQDVTEHRNWHKRSTMNPAYKGNMRTIRMTGAVPGKEMEGLPPALVEAMKAFYDASPNLEFKLGTVNPEAGAFFDVDGIYEVRFVKVGELE